MSLANFESKMLKIILFGFVVSKAWIPEKKI